MATGRLGASNLSATTYTTLYTCPASTFAVVSVSFCNRNASSRTVRLAVAAAAGTPDNAEFLEYDVSLLGNGVLERTGIVMSAGQVLTGYASATDISVVTMGIETATS